MIRAGAVGPGSGAEAAGGGVDGEMILITRHTVVGPTGTCGTIRGAFHRMPF